MKSTLAALALSLTLATVSTPAMAAAHIDYSAQWTKEADAAPVWYSDILAFFGL